jgi:hypothetical protein
MFDEIEMSHFAGDVGYLRCCCTCATVFFNDSRREYVQCVHDGD